MGRPLGAQPGRGIGDEHLPIDEVGESQAKGFDPFGFQISDLGKTKTHLQQSYPSYEISMRSVGRIFTERRARDPESKVTLTDGRTELLLLARDTVSCAGFHYLDFRLVGEDRMLELANRTGVTVSRGRDWQNDAKEQFLLRNPDGNQPALFHDGRLPMQFGWATGNVTLNRVLRLISRSKICAIRTRETSTPPC